MIDIQAIRDEWTRRNSLSQRLIMLDLCDEVERHRKAAAGCGLAVSHSWFNCPLAEPTEKRTIPAVGPQDIADSVMELKTRNKPDPPEDSDE